ncbi:hypothetical protein [Hydrogenobacter thermophilus]|uniref:hypothetical protein n=1 Tax=Hydrogenobacter thermophilus TaxID=940 RepID=UPI0030FC895C
MERVALYKELSLEAVDLRKLFEEVITKKLTGYFKISYWNLDDYILYAEGQPIWGVSIDRDGSINNLDVENYKPKSNAGTVSFYEVSLINLITFRDQQRTPPSPYNFVSYGHEFLTCMKFSHVNISGLMEQVKRSHLDGYLVLCNTRGFTHMIMFQKGLAICSYHDNTYTLGTRQRISIDKDGDCIAVYATEPELPLFLSSMNTLKKEIEDTFRSNEELGIVRKEVSDRKLSAILDVHLQKGGRMYEFFYKGTFLLRLAHMMDQVENRSLEISPGTKNTFFLYSLQVRETFPAMEVEFYTQESSPFESTYVEEEKVRWIRSYFIEEIGPIGALLWSKILKEKGYSERQMREEDLKRLIEELYMEIPDSAHASKFLEKARRLLT